jgi:hypothetical protein
MKALKSLMIFAIFLSLVGCAANIDRTRETKLSKYSEKDIKQKIIPEVTTRRDILIEFGVPVNTADYNNATQWVYHSERIDRRIYFFIPFINDRNQYITLSFSEKGVLKNYSYYEK